LTQHDSQRDFFGANGAAGVILDTCTPGGVVDGCITDSAGSTYACSVADDQKAVSDIMSGTGSAIQQRVKMPEQGSDLIVVTPRSCETFPLVDRADCVSKQLRVDRRAFDIPDYRGAAETEASEVFKRCGALRLFDVVKDCANVCQLTCQASPGCT
jgi:hypothetical protein